MAAQPKVAIRLGTEGKGEVQRDFADIGAAAEASANRAARSFDKATQDIESGLRRQAASADKLSATMPQTPTQARINMAVGTGSSLDEGSARVSAQAFRELIAEQERYAAGAAALRAQIDPAWAAQQRFNSEMGAARTLVAANAITLDDYCAKLRIEQAELDAVSVVHGRVGASAGQVKAGTQQLAFQMQDLGVQMAAAAGSGNVVKGVMTGLAMQGPQVVSAIAMMRGSAGGFIGFLAGPWGAAIMAATSVLAVLGAEFLSSGDDATKAAAKVDRYTNAINRMTIAAGKASVMDVGLSKVRVAQLEGQLRTLDTTIAGTDRTWGNRENFNALINQREALRSQLGNLKADVAGVEMAMSAQKKLDALGASPKVGGGTGSGSSGAGQSISRRAEPAISDEDRKAAVLERQRNDWLNDQGLNVGKAAGDALTKEGDALSARDSDFGRERDDLSAGTALLNMEWQLRGKSRQEIEKALELQRYQLQVQGDSRNYTAEQVQYLVDAKKAQIDWTEQVERSGALMGELRDTGERLVDTVLNPSNWKDWGDLGKQVLNDLKLEFLKLSALNPIKNLLFNSGLPTLGGGGGGILGGIGKLLGLGGASGSAIGNEYTPAGAMWVGENGPELVNMPRGAKVMNASDSRRAASGGGSPVIFAPSFDGAVMTQDLLDQMHAMMQMAAAYAIEQGSAQGAQLAAADARYNSFRSLAGR